MVENLFEALKIIVTVSILFVWFIRYDNIKKEFIEYGYATWFRDFIGILKISFSIMLHSGDSAVVAIGSIGIAFLMLGAVGTHIRVGSEFRRYIASVSMLLITSFIAYHALLL